MSDITELSIVADGRPLVLASSAFLTTLAQVEQQARELKIVDAASAQLAASLQSRLTTAGAEVEKQRTALKAPFIQIGRQIDDAAKGPVSRIEAAKTILRVSLSNFAEKQRLEAIAAEQARQAELARLEKIRQQEIEAENARKAELERIAREAAAKAPEPVEESINFDDDAVSFDEEPPAPEPVQQKTETQIAIERVQYAPVAAPVKPVGITFRTTLVATVVDVNQLPDHFVEKTAKIKAINSTFCAGWKEGNALPVCAGVKFEVKRDAVSTGRNQF